MKNSLFVTILLFAPFNVVFSQTNIDSVAVNSTPAVISDTTIQAEIITDTIAPTTSIVDTNKVETPTLPTIQEETTVKNNGELFDKILQLDKEPLYSKQRLPILTLGSGLVSFHGDVNSSVTPNFTTGCNAIHFEMTQPLSESFKFGIRYLRSELRGNTYLPNIQTFFNFKTDVNSFGAFLQYDFSNIEYIAERSRIISPYVSLGLSVLQRPEARGDWFSNGEQIYLWNDGTFRNMPQTDYNASQSHIVYRDYDYETSLQIENKNNKDSYIPIIASFPIELGISYKFSKVARLNLGYQFHIVASNTLDDITGKGVAERKGNNRPDSYSYAYASISVNLDKIPKRNKFEAIFNENYFVSWDADQDGIDETDDECPYTPKGVEVLANGCPLDDDNDGIPNYCDEERFTRAFFHDLKGNGVTEADLRNRMKEGEKLTQADLYRYYPDLLNGATVTKQFYKKIPKKFKVCDTDRNDYIDLTELLNTINSFFDEGTNAGPGSNLESKELAELIEFFFLQ